MVLIQNVDEGLEALERTDSLRETREIVEGLTGLGNKMVLPFIVAKILEMNNEGLYDAAIRAMPDEWRFEAHEYINLETLDPKRRRGATLMCRLLDTLGSRQVLLELLKDKDFMVRKDAIESLMALPDLDESIENELAQLASTDEEKIVRWAACEALVNQGTDSAFEHLKELKRQFRKDPRIEEYHQQIQEKIEGKSRYAGMTMATSWWADIRQQLFTKDARGNALIWTYIGLGVILIGVLFIVGYIGLRSGMFEQYQWFVCRYCGTRFEAKDIPNLDCPFCRNWIHEEYEQIYGPALSPWTRMGPTTPQETFDRRELAAPTATPTPEPAFLFPFSYGP